jgi:hypothetical protein
MRGKNHWPWGAIRAGLCSFETHKHKLLDALRDAYERGPKTVAFDADRAWWHLQLAAVDFLRWSKRNTTIRTPNRRRCLRKIAKAVGKARKLVQSAVQSDVGDDLFDAWAPTVDLPILTTSKLAAFSEEDPALDRYVNLETRFNGLVEALTALEAAASHASVPPGKPGKSATLPEAHIRGLAAVYRESTGREPGTGSGPFTQFAMLFLAAADPTYKITEEAGGVRVAQTMVDAVKLALGKRRKRPKRRKDPKKRHLIPYAGKQ